MKEAIKAINERIELKSQLFRYVEYVESTFDSRTEAEFKYRHEIIKKEIKSDVQELKRAKEKIIEKQV
ncbi:hypothetical protein NBRC110019_07740 [Neptunitalea chrysea]|uniref:Uncharacterized protein n=1 Tax=Neptunitalea chrysea TaxID=1647581 RepID=A0A9W6B4Z6_9FLAO|nr:hypothetical protein [Neptunitalea chrysea]GLB51735.1 hypothetical protein NBRC110019_07740 [Neptunitalea chrysea]